jgi:hypothetical protein
MLPEMIVKGIENRRQQFLHGWRECRERVTRFVIDHQEVQPLQFANARIIR